MLRGLFAGALFVLCLRSCSYASPAFFTLYCKAVKVALARVDGFTPFAVLHSMQAPSPPSWSPRRKSTARVHEGTHAQSKVAVEPHDSFTYSGLSKNLGGRRRHDDRIVIPSASGGTVGIPFVFCAATTNHLPLRFSATMIIRPNLCGRREPSGFLSP